MYACHMARGILSKSDWTQYCSERRWWFALFAMTMVMAVTVLFIL
jgi:hypothetical protein